MSGVNIMLERLLIAEQRPASPGSRRRCALWMVARRSHGFLRREVLWAGRLEVDGLPFVNLTHAVRPGFQCPPEILSRIATFPQSSAERTCCQNLGGLVRFERRSSVLCKKSVSRNSGGFKVVKSVQGRLVCSSNEGLKTGACKTGLARLLKER